MNTSTQSTTQQLAELQEDEIEQPSMALVTAIQKAEIDQQITTARAHPRSIRRFINACMDLATLNEEVAESCLYALPRGGKTIEGASARFAELLQSTFGNCRAGGRVIDEGDEFVTAEGFFHDLESNSHVAMRVKRRILDKNGQRYNSDMIGVTGNAAASIAHRNAVLKGVPKALWNPIYLAAKKTAIGDLKSLANKRAEAFEWLQKRHVSEAMALASLGVEGIEDVGLDELAQLKGAIAAVKNGEATIESAFAAKEVSAPRGKPKTDEPKAKGKKDAAPKDDAKKKPASDPAADLASAQKDVQQFIDKSGIPETEVFAHFEKGTLAEFTLQDCVQAIAWMKKAMRDG
jgi:hypothetical protein